MDFRFPHPFESVVDAIKDALDPDTPADGGLVAQLMNENNRAIEDALGGITPTPPPTLPFFVGILTYDAGGTAWTDVFNATTSTNIIEPDRDGWYLCDVTWVITGETPDTNVKVSAGGPPYKVGAGGYSNVPLDGSGNGKASAHWQGLLFAGNGLAVGCGKFFTAYVRGFRVFDL